MGSSTLSPEAHETGRASDSATDTATGTINSADAQTRGSYDSVLSSQGSPLAAVPGDVVQELDATDHQLIKEYASKGFQAQPLLMSLWDFGGQEVFSSLHHLFLTRNGVYCVVFSVVELLAEIECAATSSSSTTGTTTNTTSDNEQSVDGSSVEEPSCQHALKLWLDTVYVFAPGSPVLIVGTCKDQCTPAQLQAVLATVEDIVRQSPCSEQVVEDSAASDDEPLVCFLVDNTDSNNTCVQNLRESIEATAWDRCPFVQQEVPVEWIAVLDRLNALCKNPDPRNRVALEEVFEIARDCNLGNTGDVTFDDEVMGMLSTFHDMGLLMHYDEEELRTMVILSPQWLIDAASTIIRDFDMHRMPCDRLAERSIEHKESWHLLKHEAKLRKSLTAILWPSSAGRSSSSSSSASTEGLMDYTATERDILLTLLERFGLIVPHYRESVDRAYLVPSLLPLATSLPPQRLGSKYAVLAFDMDVNIQRGARDRGKTWRHQELRRGFLPPGLFPRLLGKAVARSQQTNGTQPVLTRRHAVLSFGVSEFELREDRAHNCVWVTTDSPRPSAVLDQITLLAGEVVAEYLCNRVSFHLLLAIYESDNGPVWVSHATMLTAVASGQATSFDNQHFSCETLQRVFHAWLPVQEAATTAAVTGTATTTASSGECGVYIHNHARDGKFAVKLLAECNVMQVLAGRVVSPHLVDAAAGAMARLQSMRQASIIVTIISMAALQPLFAAKNTSQQMDSIEDTLLEW